MNLRHHDPFQPLRHGRKVLLPTLVGIGVLLLGAAGCNPGDGASAAPTVAENTTEAEFTIQGMTCASCTLTVKTAARKVPGVAEVRVSLEEKRAWVSYDAGQTSPAAIASAISAAGYTAAPVVPADGAPQAERGGRP